MENFYEGEEEDFKIWWPSYYVKSRLIVKNLKVWWYTTRIFRVWLEILSTTIRAWERKKMWHFYRVVYRNVNSATWWPGTVHLRLQLILVVISLHLMSQHAVWCFLEYFNCFLGLFISAYTDIEFRWLCVTLLEHVLTILWLNSISKLTHDEWKNCYYKYEKNQSASSKVKKNSIQFSSIYMLHRKMSKILRSIG